ncbi:MAG: NADH-quinone oxidoreductase subunit J [Candidatus Caenarcaniphilales bacterium]|nr:NADH-quinone oxidoreductase subunit J [Candidatus Caenarcaniphilales bacterium]
MSILDFLQALSYNFFLQLTTDPAFTVLATLILATALAVVTQNNLVRAGFLLAGCFAAIAFLFFALGAELVAASQILIYAVGITLVVIFAIMLLSGSMDNAEEIEPNQEIDKFNHSIAYLISLGLFMCLAVALMGLPSGAPQLQTQNLIDTMVTYIGANRSELFHAEQITNIGRILFSEQILAFELVSVLLLVAFVGAIVLSKRKV